MVARVLFAINGFLLYLRLLRVYHTSFSLGPKLIVFQKMMPQLWTFIVLLVVFLLGYGMASQALIFRAPEGKFKTEYIANYSLIKGIVFAPYWQMYGELNIDDIDQKIDENEPRSLLDSTLVCDEGDGLSENCEDFSNYKFVVKTMLGAYLLIGNVMLLNMLIAIFSHIFEKVEKNAKAVWWYELYSLVEEYDQMPGLGPIFCPLEIVYKMIRGLRDRCCCASKQREIEREQEMKESEAQSYFNEKFELFEKDSFNTYIKRQAEHHEAHFETKVMKKVEKLIEMKRKIERSFQKEQYVN